MAGTDMAIDEHTKKRYKRMLENAKRYGEQMSEEDKKRYREWVDPPSGVPISPPDDATREPPK